MKSLAELLVFALGWFAIMALIGVICWAVNRWGAKRQKIEEQHPENEQTESEN